MERAGEAQAEAQRLAGAETSRDLEYQKVGTQLGMAQQRLAAANQAAEAESGGGLLSTISSVASAAVPGLGAISSMFSKD